MTIKYSQGVYTVKNPDKYVGKGKPRWRSSWELNFMLWCDNNKGVVKWASEPIRIPYRNPITGKNTTYVPDFFIQYIDKDNKIHNEIIEIKPEKHQLMEKAGKSKYNQYQVVINQAKWNSAMIYCKKQGLIFRILNETQLFHNGKAK